MPERINGGQALVVLGAVALIVSLFLHWYEPGRSAWTVFEVWDLVLPAIAVAAIVLASGVVLSRARISLVITLRSNGRGRAAPPPAEPADPAVDPDAATQTLRRQS